jgi:sarcosine oxidase, subunit beta
VTGSRPPAGVIEAEGGLVVAGHSSVLANMAGLRLPVESPPLQALVSEPLKPVLDTVVMSNAVHGYVSQSDKGELVIGAGIDGYNGYGQRGSFPTIEEHAAAIVELFPIFSRVRMLRQWGGIVDTCPDACPIIGKTPVRGCTSTAAGAPAASRPRPARAGSSPTPSPATSRTAQRAVLLDRFHTGRLIDEHGAAAVAH